MNSAMRQKLIAAVAGMRSLRWNASGVARKTLALLPVWAVACAVHSQTMDEPAPDHPNMDHQHMDHRTMDHAAHMRMMADAQRQAQVAQRGKDVMPFDLAATTHLFAKNETGGVQQVVVKTPGDDAQIGLIRKHLQSLQVQFLQGDFSGPQHIHGHAMPGLAELQAAKPGQIAIHYQDIQDGAELTYSTSDAGLVAALHQWFDAQLADHGKDAMEGHMDHDGMKMQ